MAIAMALNASLYFFQQAAGLVKIFDIPLSFLKCTGGDIGRRHQGIPHGISPSDVQQEALNFLVY
jgi:hypothetical protein